MFGLDGLPIWHCPASAQPAHGDIGSGQVDYNKPNRSRKHKGVGDAADQEESADKKSEFHFMSAGNLRSQKSAGQRAQGMREEGHDKVFGLKQVYAFFKAFHISRIDTFRRWDNGTAQHDEPHIYRAADQHTGNDRQDIFYNWIHFPCIMLRSAAYIVVAKM